MGLIRGNIHPPIGDIHVMVHRGGCDNCERLQTADPQTCELAEDSNLRVPADASRKRNRIQEGVTCGILRKIMGPDKVIDSPGGADNRMTQGPVTINQSQYTIYHRCNPYERLGV